MSVVALGLMAALQFAYTLPVIRLAIELEAPRMIGSVWVPLFGAAVAGMLAFGVARRSRAATRFAIGLTVVAALSSALGAMSTAPYIRIVQAGQAVAAGTAVLSLSMVASAGDWRPRRARPRASEATPALKIIRGVLVVIAAFLSATAVVYVLYLMVALAILLPFVLLLMTVGAGPGSPAELATIPEAGLRHPDAEIVSAGARSAEGNFTGGLAATIGARFRTDESMEDVIEWYRGAILPPDWVEVGRGVMLSDQDGFGWCSDARDARIQLRHTEPGHFAHDPHAFSVTMFARGPDEPCFYGDLDACGFPNDTPVAWSGWASLSRLGIDSDADRAGVAAVSQTGLDEMGGSRAYCIEYGDGSTAAGPVPDDWQLPAGYEPPPR